MTNCLHWTNRQNVNWISLLKNCNSKFRSEQLLLPNTFHLTTQFWAARITSINYTSCQQIWLINKRSTCNFGIIRAAPDVFVAEFDGNFVFARCRGQIGHRHGAVLVVVARDLGLAGPLHGHREATRSSPLCRDGEIRRLTAHAINQTWTVRCYVTTCQGIDVELVWRT